VSHGSGAFLGRVTDRLLAAHRPYLRPVAQSDLTSALAHLAVAGVGVGWLPSALTLSAVADVSVVELGDAAWSADLEIRLCRSCDRRSSRQVTEVWERARQDAAGPR